MATRNKEDIISKAARALSARGASKGGKARAENLSPEERSDSARKAAIAKWAAKKELPKETHTGPFKLLNDIPCSVLEGGLRVFAARPLRRMFGSKMTGTSASRSIEDRALELPPFLASGKIFPHVPADLIERLKNPITYIPKGGGSYALGYEAKLIPDICKCIMIANKKTDGGLGVRYASMVDAAERLIFGLATFGINAMVDEYTGYQADKTSEEIEKYLESFLGLKLLPIDKKKPRFPPVFFQQIYRLNNFPYKPGVTQGPRYVGKLIVKYIYKRLPEGVWEKLDERNPPINGRRKVKMWRQLSEDVGWPATDRLLSAVTALMADADTMEQFDAKMTRVFPLPKTTTAISTDKADRSRRLNPARSDLCDK